MMTCTHRFDVDDMCIDCGYDDGLRYMQPTQAVLRLAALPRPAGEQHDMEPPHDLCLGDDPCACIQLVACEQRVRQSAATLWDRTSEQMAAARVEGIRAGLTAAREAVAALTTDLALSDQDTVVYRADVIAAIDALRQEKG